jgi:hypothetical protein
MPYRENQGERRYYSVPRMDGGKGSVLLLSFLNQIYPRGEQIAEGS